VEEGQDTLRCLEVRKNEVERRERLQSQREIPGKEDDLNVVLGRKENNLRLDKPADKPLLQHSPPPQSQSFFSLCSFHRCASGVETGY